MGKIRELKSDECRILFMRHEAYNDRTGLLTRAGERAAVATGAKLKKAGISFVAAFCSTMVRTMQTAIEVMRGMGYVVRIENEFRLSGMGPPPRKIIRAAALLTEIAFQNLRETVLVVSHSGSIIEPVVMFLRSGEYNDPPQHIDNGQIIELIINSSGELVELYWLVEPYWLKKE